MARGRIRNAAESRKSNCVITAIPGDIGFDILLQPTRRSLGAWSFRAEAQKLGGRWRITTWYPVATYAPPEKTQTVVGPNDLGPANGASAAGGSSRLGS